MTFELLIDGQPVDGAATLDVINPATGEAFATCPRAAEAQPEAALAAAKRAFPGQAGFKTEARLEEFATLLTKEQGKQVAQSRGEIPVS